MDMKVALYQMECAWEDPAANRALVTEWMERQFAEGVVDLVVLPEMFSTGFSMTPERIAEPMGGDTVRWLSAMAQRFQTAIVCSVAIREEHAGGKTNYFNRLFFVRPDGSFETYDKRHLFRMAGEHHKYTMGEEKVIVEYKGWRIRPLVCYDLRFPVWSRNREDYDLLIYVASWPEPRAYAWKSLLRARAIENLSYVIGVNRVGHDPKVSYSGDTVVLDFMGMPIVEAVPSRAEWVTATLDKEAMNRFREAFPAYQDADLFEMQDDQ